MQDPTLSEVENSIATAVENYLLAKPNDRISEDEDLRPVCSRLARWLHAELKNNDEWGPYRSVDDLLPCTADRLSKTGLALQGLLIWMDDRTRDWVEPLLAKIHLSGDPAAPLELEVRLGDAKQGLGRTPYGTPLDYPLVPVDRWLFAFVAPHPKV
jgi:hypothetical protein